MTTTVKLYSAIAQLMAAIERCKSASPDSLAQTHHLPLHEERLHRLVKRFMPSGSGFDSGTQLLADECKSNRLVLQADYHHMNGNGYYTGWTEHQVIVTPSLACGAVIRITGRDRNSTKDYIADVFQHALNEMVDPFAI